VINFSTRPFAERRRVFPDPAAPTLDGIVAMGDQLNRETLLEAYSFGMFPWPHAEMPCLWFCPDERGIIDFADLRINRSLQKQIRKTKFRFTANKCFAEVVRACSQVPRPGQSGTWITDQIINAYEDFHRAGYAHSVECWEQDQLVGGIYGVFVAGVFSGESMFFKRSNASKICLIKLIEQLQKNGLTWMDIQMVTSVTESLGGRYVAKKEYLERLANTKKLFSVAPKALIWPEYL